MYLHPKQQPINGEHTLVPLKFEEFCGLRDSPIHNAVKVVVEILWDKFCEEGRTADKSHVNRTCNHYGMWKEDIAREFTKLLFELTCQ